MRKSLTLLTLLFSIFCQGTAQSPNNLDSLLANSTQLLHVETSSIPATHGTMNLYERKNEHKRWKLVYSFPVTVGRTGLAKDPQNVMQLPDILPVKHEGDGKSPACPQCG